VRRFHFFLPPMKTSLELITGPTSEPVLTDDAKLWTVIGNDADDALLNMLIPAARAHVERITGKALLEQTWKLWLDSFPGGDYFEIPKAPVSSVTSIKYYQADGSAAVTISPSVYEVDTYSTVPRVVLAYQQSWPVAILRSTRGVEVEFVAGYEDFDHLAASQDVELRLPILMLVAHWYANREAVSMERMVTPATVPLAFDALVQNHKLYTDR
jgi:uncharacterized phiE125 gp8 family phage protein